MKKALPAFFAVLLPMTVGAIDEQGFEQQWSDLVAPWLAEQSAAGDLAGTGGVTLRYLAIEKPEPKAVLLVIGGHSESFYKYAELFYDLRDLEVSIYALDPRGQGSSDRLLPDREKSHVDRWQDYVDDLRIFLRAVVRSRTDAPVIVLGHSLGGGMAAALLEQDPAAVDAAILSAPLVGHRIGGGAKALLAVMDAFGGRGYVPGGGPFAPVAFDANKETHSPARHARKLKDYADHPQIRLGHPTVHWMMETSRMAEAVQAGAGKITVPVLLFQAAEDQYVDAASLQAFAANVQGCRRELVDGARHEMLIETDAIRSRVLVEIRTFVQGRLQAAGH